MKTKLPSPIEVALAISNHQCPIDRLPGEGMDWVLLGKATRSAEAEGYIRVNHGCFDDWGGYKVTEKGHEALRKRQEDLY